MRLLKWLKDKVLGAQCPGCGARAVYEGREEVGQQDARDTSLGREVVHRYRTYRKCRNCNWDGTTNSWEETWYEGW